MEELPPEEDRCSRKGSTNWQCPNRVVPGKSYCLKHHLLNISRNHRRKSAAAAGETTSDGMLPAPTIDNISVEPYRPVIDFSYQQQQFSCSSEFGDDNGRFVPQNFPVWTGGLGEPVGGDVKTVGWFSCSDLLLDDSVLDFDRFMGELDLVNDETALGGGGSIPQSSGVNKSGLWWLGLEKLQDELEKIGSKIKRHEDNMKFLKGKKNQLDDAILDFQVSLGNYISSSAPKTEDDNTPGVRIEVETMELILKHDTSAAGIFCQLQRHHGTQLLNLTLSQDVLGVVATLGKVDDDILTRLFSEYLGLQTMLAIVCKSYEGSKALEIYDGEGIVNKSSGIHGLAASIGRALPDRFHVICLDTLRPYPGEIIADDPQNRLNMPKPRLPSGETPAGFLGYAVNMIHVDRPHLFCVTSNGCGLRETLFYNLFSRLQVYKTRAEMLLALPFICDGAVSLDGGVIRAPGVFSLGSREDVDVWFPKPSKRSELSDKCSELENQIKEKKWERGRIQDDIRREQALLDQEKYNFSLRREDCLRALTESSAYMVQHQMQTAAQHRQSPR